MKILRKPHPLAMFCAWFLMVFLVLFPKGGFKIGPIPLTWAAVFLAISVLPAFLVRLLMLPLRIPGRLLVTLALMLPMQLLFLYDLAFYGTTNVGYLISLLCGFIFLPVIFLLVYAPFLVYIDGVRLSRYFRLCILLAALWGILLFIWHPITGKFLEVPYLTVNAADYGDLEYTKHINRGLFFKLISTYNNGNLYGVCMLTLLPMYDFLEPVRWRRYALKVALLMTLSRTVWAGLILSEILSVAILLSKQVSTFPRLYLDKAARRVGALVVITGLVFLSLLFNSNNLAFLFDPQLGGRTSLLANLPSFTFLPTSAVNGLQEAAYLSALTHFGISGLLAFTLLMLSPLLLLLVDSSALRSPIRRAALKGLVVYALIANIDAGFSYIPTTAFYWFVYMVYIFGWPAAHEALIRRTSSSGMPVDPAPAVFDNVLVAAKTNPAAVI